jgi:hypothetical protein
MFSGLTAYLRTSCQVLSTADKYRHDSQLSERQAELTALDRQITGLASDIETSSAAYGTQVDAAIKQKVAERRDDQGPFIGLLDEVAALGRLSAKSWFVFSAEWLLRLLLIALDCTAAADTRLP